MKINNVNARRQELEKLSSTMEKLYTYNKNI